MKKLDKLENEFLPQVTVDKTEVCDLPTSYINLDDTVEHKVPVQFEFIKKLSDISYCKEWLNIKPYTDFILPGTYVPSCFGSSLEALVKMTKPIRSVAVDILIDLVSDGQTTDVSVWRHGDMCRKLPPPSRPPSPQQWTRNIWRSLKKPCWGFPDPGRPSQSPPQCVPLPHPLPTGAPQTFQLQQARARDVRYVQYTQPWNFKLTETERFTASIFGTILLKSPPGGELLETTGYKKMSQQIQERKKQTFVLQFLMNDFLETTLPP
ncbi:OCRL [Cordylochernes scorpioides]|uniref:OCRL n=1 Tax=Cordylochernes scorpioides TaxID=51811 RepID=A0ABY6L2Y5_9ARAC|nr:OCRL [Cordylochernes scorpioides]